MLSRENCTLQADHGACKADREKLLDRLRDAENAIETERAELATARAAMEKERKSLTAQLDASQSMVRSVARLHRASDLAILI